MEPLNVTILGNTLLRWILAVASTAAIYVGFRLFKSKVIHYISAIAKKTKAEWDDLLLELLENKTKRFFLIVLAIYVGTLFLTLPGRVSIIVRDVTLVALFLQIALWGNASIAWISERAKKKADQDPDSLSTYTAIAFLGKLLLWSLLLLLLLHNLGVNVTALVASLGVGGIAVALAVQNILGDLFASMSIVLDKPFMVGDFIIVDSLMGTVEHIGLKTTRIRSLSGEQIVFSNNDLLNSRIRNYKRMWERRVVFSVGVTYQTPHEKLATIPDMIREIVESQELARFDRAHFKSFGDFALIYEVVYYVKVPDYNKYMDTQQAINLAVYQRFSEEGIEFAYPTQTIFLEKSEMIGEADRSNTSGRE